ncbi:MAG: hypothetical protein ACP5KY_07990, partial [Thermoproteus sp.]
VQEEVLVRLRVLDADGANPVLGTQSIKVQQYNGSITTLPVTNAITITSAFFQANRVHKIIGLKWWGYTVENGTASWAQFYSPFNVPSSSANGTADVVFPRIWANLGGSGAEIWLRSQSIVTSVVWDSGRGVIYIQSEKKTGETYFYYGFYGAPPKYVYIDGVLFSDVGYQVDTANQIIRITVGGGSFLFDFTGKTQPPPQTDLYSMIQQLYAILSTLSIRQPSPAAPAVNVTVIDLSWLRNIYAAIAASFDRVSPVPSSIAFPGIFLAVTFTAILAALTRVRRAPERGAKVVVVREPRYRSDFVRWAAATIATTLVMTPLLYYVFPRVFPRYFEQPAIDFRLFLFAALAATAIAIVFVAVILLGTGKARGEVQE